MRSNSLGACWGTVESMQAQVRGGSGSWRLCQISHVDCDALLMTLRRKSEDGDA